ncbi:ricin-type beta-trefoil lectin domain protein [Spirosoma sp. KCTC 42546]|uniref:RICIN domain-containing protein n=1 Tax=Spirosoma sp. KCTC 42546 TaxID=2520506 RepID=UPI0011597E47|nr:RICIN domain-containing protein [Spirosoma sp. KCTC 42546]QDK80280.1 ricin-type beta-trefoil lectin domain protein [Spirosoma sp. KCTC 42546]
MKTKLIGLIVIGLTVLTKASFAQVIRGTYAIKNTQTGLVLRVQDARKANGTPIVSYSPVNWKCVTWDFNHVEGETYQLRNLFTNKTLQPIAATPTEGISLEQQPLVSLQANQEYEFLRTGKDTYRIKLKGSDLYLTPSDAGTVNAKVVLAKKTAGANQVWTIYPQDPEI